MFNLLCYIVIGVAVIWDVYVLVNPGALFAKLLTLAASALIIFVQVMLVKRNKAKKEKRKAAKLEKKAKKQAKKEAKETEV